MVKGPRKWSKVKVKVNFHIFQPLQLATVTIVLVIVYLIWSISHYGIIGNELEWPWPQSLIFIGKVIQWYWPFWYIPNIFCRIVFPNMSPALPRCVIYDLTWRSRYWPRSMTEGHNWNRHSARTSTIGRFSQPLNFLDLRGHTSLPRPPPVLVSARLISRAGIMIKVASAKKRVMVSRFWKKSGASSCNGFSKSR